LDEERELRVGHETLDAQLFPFETPPVGEMSRTEDGFTLEALFVRSQVVCGDDPSEPPSAEIASCTDSLPVWCFLRCRMVQNFDDLNMAVLSQWNQPDTRAETGVEAAVDRFHTEKRLQAFSFGLQSLRTCGIDDMIEMHASILHCWFPLPEIGLRDGRLVSIYDTANVPGWERVVGMNRRIRYATTRSAMRLRRAKLIS